MKTAEVGGGCMCVGGGTGCKNRELGSRFELLELFFPFKDRHCLVLFFLSRLSCSFLTKGTPREGSTF